MVLLFILAILNPPMDDLCQVRLKLTTWFWRKCKDLQIDGRTDRRSTGGQKGYLSFQLSWAKTDQTMYGANHNSSII
jgi:hypothetical protein